MFVFSQSSLIGGIDGSTQDMFDEGGGDDTLFLSLTESTEESITNADDIRNALDGIGVSTQSIEEIKFIDSSADLVATLETNSLITEADLWGLI